MKVAVATDDKINISHHFGRTLGFRVFDIQDKKILNEEYRQNIGKSNGQCGSCDHSSMVNNIKDCDLVICYGMGQGIYNDLVRNNIQAIITEEITVDNAIKSLMGDELINRLDRLH
jgi:predicted Fe-Mo cluster-binding NifX family protein